MQSHNNRREEMKKFTIIVFLCVFLCFGCSSEYNFDLVSIETNENIHGTFFLGCGSINESICYFAYIKVNDEIIPIYVPYSSVKIKFTSDKPYMHVTGLIGGNIRSSFYHRSYTFYVPEGSIKQIINLNLNK